MSEIHDYEIINEEGKYIQHVETLQTLETYELRQQYLHNNKLMFVELNLSYDTGEQHLYKQLFNYPQNETDFLNQLFTYCDEDELINLIKVRTATYYIKQDDFPEWLDDIDGIFKFHIEKYNTIKQNFINKNFN